MTNCKKYSEAGIELLQYSRFHKIPYMQNGHTMAGMDCQGLAEYLLVQCGVPYSECNRAGSNSHLRECTWRGTPEKCKAEFGEVPEGAWIFIVKENGGEPTQYRGDGIGNAEHMGVYLGGKQVIHASASRGMVVESKFEGKTVSNGGWNMVGLPKWVDYGIKPKQEMQAKAQETAKQAGQSIQEGVGRVPEDVSRFYTVRRGCLGGAVERAQRWLQELGYSVGTTGADGDFGPATEAAVRLFQQRQGLQVDGIVGQRTWSEMAWLRAKG